jgi:hypothetical protein
MYGRFLDFTYLLIGLTEGEEIEPVHVPGIHRMRSRRGNSAALCLPGCDFGALMRDCAYQRESDVGEWDSEVV